MLDKLNDKEREFLENAIRAGATAPDATIMALDDIINMDEEE